MARVTKRDVWLALAIISFASVAKLMAYLPGWGLLLYLACVGAVLARAPSMLMSLGAARPSDRRVRQLVAAALLLLAIVFLVGHPALERWAADHGGGSDRDEALERAARALVTTGRPYAIALSTGHPISPMPGELILALPFVLVGMAGLQNIVWLGLYCAALAATLSSEWLAALGLFGMLLLAPGVVHEVITAGDLLATSVYIATGCMWLILQARRRPSGIGRALALGVLFGIMLSSRLTYLLIVPLVLATLVRIQGTRAAWLVSAGTAIGFTGVTAPFFPWSSGTFGPSHIFEKVNLISDVPYASWLIMGISSAHSALASWLILRGDAQRLFAHATYVLLTPVGLTVLLCSFELGLDAISQFGLYALWCVPFATATLARYAQHARRRPGIAQRTHVQIE